MGRFGAWVGRVVWRLLERLAEPWDGVVLVVAPCAEPFLYVDPEWYAARCVASVDEDGR